MWRSLSYRNMQSVSLTKKQHIRFVKHRCMYSTSPRMKGGTPHWHLMQCSAHSPRAQSQYSIRAWRAFYRSHFAARSHFRQHPFRIDELTWSEHIPAALCYRCPKRSVGFSVELNGLFLLNIADGFAGFRCQHLPATMRFSFMHISMANRIRNNKSATRQTSCICDDVGTLPFVRSLVWPAILLVEKCTHFCGYSEPLTEMMNVAESANWLRNILHFFSYVAHFTLLCTHIHQAAMTFRSERISCH